jgi:metal-responsive CopG/Arc/MetJ family transcriptional regulator
VPGKRSAGQKVIAFPLDEDLLDELDRVRGSMNRSQFIREALAIKLGVDPRKTAAPDRAGKGRKAGVGKVKNVRKKIDKEKQL